MEEILKELSKLEAFYKLDPNIGSEDPRIIPTLPDTVDIELLTKALDFYSPDEKERIYAFNREIEIPLRKLLVDVAKCCLKWPGKAKHVALFYCLDDAIFPHELKELITVAIKDIFSDSDYGLDALRCAIEELKDTEELQAESLEKLVLFRKLAGYIYDRKALEKLCEMALLVKSIGNISEWNVRLSMLRFIQVAGEYFKLLLPSTLNSTSGSSCKAICISKTLSDLRDKLSHLSIKKLQALKNCNDAVFKDVQTDITHLETALQEMSKCYQQRKDNYKALWNDLKKLPENTTTQHGCTCTWFKDLKTLLEPPGRGGSRADVNYDECVEELLHFEHTEKKKEKELINFFSTLNKKMKKDHTSLDVTLKAMQITREEHDRRKSELGKIKGVTEQKKKLKDLIMRIKPCFGNGNLSKKYEDFRTDCDTILSEDNEVFKWMSDPTSKVEKVFHKVHITSISDKADKVKLRLSKIEELISMIEALQETVDSGQSLEFLPTDYEIANRKICSAKAAYITDAISTYPADMTEQLKNLQAQFADSNDIINKADTIVMRFPEILDPLKLKLKIMSHEQHYWKMLSRCVEDKIKKNHRCLPSSNVTTMIITKCYTSTSTRTESESQQLIMAHQFFVASIYELLKEISDYPELTCFLNVTNQVRNHFLHPDPFQKTVLDIDTFETVSIKDHKFKLAKEVAILSINVKFILKCLEKSLR